MKKRKKINFAVIGCGHIGPRHAGHIYNNKDANLIAVCDIKIRRAKEVAEKYNCPIVERDYKKLLNNKDIDVVNICVPNYLHAKMTIDFLENGKHVVCEKPMCIKTKEGLEMISHEKRTGKYLFIVKQNRYNPPVTEVKKVIDKGLLGKIYMCNASLYWNRNSKYYSRSDWKGIKNKDGGTLFTQFSHFIDILLWLNGKVKSVVAETKNYTHPSIEFEDTGVVILKFDNGSIGTINFTTCAYERNMEGSIYILGTKGSVKIGGEYINMLDFWSVSGIKKPILKKSSPPNNYGFYQGSMSNHDKVIQNVVDVLMEKEDIKTTSEEGLETVKVVNAIYKSAKEHKEIYLK